jgi:AcrR family transcriptional regulator
MKPELRREQILRAATEVFAKKGYHQASITDIIKAADIARGTFYLYFEGKREIFSELVDVLTVRLIGCMRRVDLSAGSPPWIDQIRANVVRIATILVEERELTQILYNHAMGLDEDFDQKIRQFYEAITRQTEGAFRLGQDMGLIRKDINPRLAALHLVGSVKEIMFRTTQAKDADLSVEELVDELVSYSARGLLVGDGKSGKKSSKPKKKSKR